MTSSKLRLWESALLLAFGLTLTAGVWASASEAALAGQVLRLHVVANSDSQEDQALKLLARDAVLERASALLYGVSDRQGAEAALAPHLDELALAASQALADAGCGDEVRVTLTDQWFPTKAYDGFSLPAGQYRALRVSIGEGAGQNWWCVVFPAAVPGLRHRGERGDRGRPSAQRGPGGPHHRAGRGLCAQVPPHRVVGGAAAKAG